MKIPFLDISRQNKAVMDEINTAMVDIFAKNSFIGGEYVLDFEREVADYLGVKNVVSCGNGTDALILALRACGVGAGDEVITTAFSFFATAEAIAYVGAKPVFVDIRERDYLIDPDMIEGKITDRTKAILPVHIFGAPCDMDGIKAIADKHSLKVIEDAAQAIGSRYRGKYIGNFGDITCFSFYPTKNLGGCGDGGMVTTENDDLYTILSAFHEHGAGKNGAVAKGLMDGEEYTFSIDEKTGNSYDPYRYYNYLIGCNSRLDAIQAAILSIKLKHLGEYNKERANIAGRYTDGLCHEVRKPVYGDDIKPCWHQYVVLSPLKYELCDYLSEKGIGVGTFYPVPLHLQKAFAELDYKEGKLPVAERICNESICLPIYPGLTDEEVDAVIGCVNQFFKERA